MATLNLNKNSFFYKRLSEDAEQREVIQDLDRAFVEHGNRMRQRRTLDPSVTRTTRGIREGDRLTADFLERVISSLEFSNRASAIDHVVSRYPFHFDENRNVIRPC